MGTEQGSPTCPVRLTINGWTYSCQRVFYHSSEYHWWNRPDVKGLQGNTPVQRVKWNKNEIWIDDGNLEFGAQAS